MTAAAILKAIYADWRLVKTRSAVQLVFEIDASQADLAYKVLGGMPQTGAQVDVAIARLQPMSDMNDAQQAHHPAGGGFGSTTTSNQPYFSNPFGQAIGGLGAGGQEIPRVAPVAQGSERRTVDADVAGSSPAGRAKSPERRARERCAILSSDVGFLGWLTRGPCVAWKSFNPNHDGPAMVRHALWAASRSEIETNPEVYQRWVKLVGAYDDFQRYGDRAR